MDYSNQHDAVFSYALALFHHTANNKKETGSWKWTALAAAIPTSIRMVSCILFATAARMMG